jgi:hypothetical protein
MSVEINSLATVRGLGGNVPAVLDHNTDVAEDAFIVTEFVEGPTLTKYLLANGPMRIDDAVVLVRALARTIKLGHDVGILHRDIKPNNIIVRGGDFRQPVLLDYGISFDFETGPQADLTRTGEMLDSRFLSLPERRVLGGNQRDPCSDVTQLCGILFYAISGVAPVELQDQIKLPPHRRSYDSLTAAKSDPRWRSMESLFDRGFEWSVADRFQSIGQFLERLELALSVRPKAGGDISALAAEVGVRLEKARPDIAYAKELERIKKVAIRIRQAAACRISSITAGEFQVTVNQNVSGGTAPPSGIQVVDTPHLTVQVQYKRTKHWAQASYVFAYRKPEIAILKHRVGVIPGRMLTVPTPNLGFLGLDGSPRPVQENETVELGWNELCWFRDFDDQIATNLADDAKVFIEEALHWLEDQIKSAT